MDIAQLVHEQRFFYKSNATKDFRFRKEALIRLKKAVIAHEKEITQALWQDLRKSEFESFSTEISMVMGEIDFALKNLAAWTRPIRQKTPLFLFPSKSRIQYEPYGVVLIASPWNYPFQLLFSPLVGAIAAGNCIVLKPSHQSPNVSKVIGNLISETFPSNYIAVAENNETKPNEWLTPHYDYIFFTGGTDFGKKVMQAAAVHLTPLTLELGGKSPCIVDKDANLDTAARRIVWGKFLNCGQTCVAPDYLFVHTAVKNELLEKLQKEITAQFGEDPQQSPDYGRIINLNHFNRLLLLTKQGHVINKGRCNEEDLYIPPTLVTGINREFRVLDDEIFGPILPIMEYDDIRDVTRYINQQKRPLALYYFTENKKDARYMLSQTSSGGACINDVIIHVANRNLPFGGVGHSGIGAYHGRHSFTTFSHARSVMWSSTRIEFKLKFAPYAGKLKWLKKLM